MRSLLIPVFASLCLSWPAAAGAQEQTVRRFALVVGANSGGADRAQLRYATTDARSFAAVMQQLGGVQSGDKSVLLNPNRQVLLAAFDQLAERIRKAKRQNQRVEFMFYFSGHSDEAGLLLDTEKVSYRETRAGIDRLPADVRVAVLDSCASGAFTRLKGGKRRAPFLYDASSSVTGHAFLTSSSEDEAAQESDRIRASFFTHYLVSGLRGAADFSGDGRVTLNEAYRFAFDETLAQTESAKGGPQHAAYEIQLVGTGDLVMTDLRQTSAALSIDTEIEGRLYIRDPSGQLVAELFKTAGRVVELGLPPGEYHIVADQKGRLSRAIVTLQDQKVTRLGSPQLAPIQPEDTVQRGPEIEPGAAEPQAPAAGAPEPEAGEEAKEQPAEGQKPEAGEPAKAGEKPAADEKKKTKEQPKEDKYRTLPFAVALFPPADTNSIAEEKVINNVGVNVILGRAAKIRGFQIGLGVNWADEEVNGVQGAIGGNYDGGKLRGVQGSVGINAAKEVYGVQAAVGANTSEPIEGVQASVGANVATDLKGVQASVGANIASDVLGAQATVGANIADKMRGVQASVGANVAYDKFYGVQAAVGGNWTPDAEGAQLAHVNVAEQIKGAQIGLINVTTGRVRGLQLGLFNYADEADASIGLIGITRKGGLRPMVWTSDTGLLNAGLRFDANYTYTFLSAGFFPFGDGKSGTFGAGIGVKPQLAKQVWLDIDLSTHLVLMKKRFKGNPSLHQLRLLARWQLYPHLSLFAGPTFNLQTHWDIDDNPEDAGHRPGYGYKVYEKTHDNVELIFWPGFALGAQF